MRQPTVLISQLVLHAEVVTYAHVSLSVEGFVTAWGQNGIKN